MKNIYKIISMLLTVIMILSSLTVLLTVDVFAAGETDKTESTDSKENETNKPKKSIDYLTHYFATPDDKLATMEVAYEKDGVRIYVDSESGEVAYVNTKTGEKLFTNPYDVASSTGNEATKYEILSQIIVTFKDGVGQERIFTSYEEAASRGQIVVEDIKGGIRVEYTIGREQSKILVPRLISMDRFEEMILTPLLEVFGEELYNPRSQNTDVFDVQKMLSYFMVYSVDKLDLSKKERQNMENTYGGLYDDLISSDAQYARALKKFPIVETMPVYVFDPDASEAELSHAEEIITKYCPEYTYEELEYDHILTEYKSDDANPPVFRMALEYKADESGLSVRLPANGIRFNESIYTLEHIQILPYMGAGNSAYEGYNFFPDGSGALFDFMSLNTNQTRAVSGKVYGTDFAYHEITGTYQKTIRYPVFGIVEETEYYTFEQFDRYDGEKVYESKIAGNIVEAIEAYLNEETLHFCNGQESKLYQTFHHKGRNELEDKDGNPMPYDKIVELYGEIYIPPTSDTIATKSVEKRGFVCVIEEGDALASLTTYHAGALSDYNTVKMQFTPRPKDSYNISDSISVGSNSEWTVVSDRKYVGNYTMKYITLSDTEKNAKSADESANYDASWFGMAVAYRDYLTEKGIISQLNDKQITEGIIPLYIETFGTIETTEKILSIPVTVMAPLTTFDNIETMYKELYDQGMKNINFKLTGYANGGMQYTMPGKLKFEKAVGGNKGFQELLDAAAEANKKENSNFGVFPDFDFAYTMNSDWFDGHSAYDHNAKTIDDRYASRRVYKATQQKYENYHEMVISPAYFVEFYEKLKGNYADKYTNIFGISVSTLGNALNSDFDEDEPYNREDSKEFTVEAFKHFSDNYNEVMTDGGNAYVWKYVDHILGVSLDSSRYNFAAETVPFIGVVLHGSIRFAGEPLNMEGDLKYAMLKAIENGASPYFILSYQNTQVLKEDELLSKYYSIRYDIWNDDIVDTYTALNDILGDVQDKYITGHQFLSGATRIPDSDELINDILGSYNTTLDEHRNAAELLQKELEKAAYIARENGRLAEQHAAEAAAKVIGLYTQQMQFVNSVAWHNSTLYSNAKAAYEEYRKVQSFQFSENPDERIKFDRMNQIYMIVKNYNVDYTTLVEKYDTDYAKYYATFVGSDFRSYYEDFNSIYAMYASDDEEKKIAYAQMTAALAKKVAEDKLDEAREAFKDGEINEAAYIAVVDAYGAALVDVSVIEHAIRDYINGNLDRSALKNAATEYRANKKAEEYKVIFENTLAAYLDGTLADTALPSIIEGWFDSVESIDKATFETKIADFKNGKLSASKFEAEIAKYCASKFDKATILELAEKLIDARRAFVIAENNYTLDPYADAETEFAAAEKAYNEALGTFDSKVKTYLSNTNIKNFEAAIKAFEVAQTEYEAAIARKTVDKTDAAAKYTEAKNAFDAASLAVSNFVIDAMDTEKAIADVNNVAEKAEAYIVYMAGKDAFAKARESGFAVSYDDCYGTYYAFYSTQKYSSFNKIIASDSYTEEDYANYSSFYLAKNEKEALDAEIKSNVTRPKTFDNYIIALAENDFANEHPELFTEEEIAMKTNDMKNARKSAISGAFQVDKNDTLVTIEETYKIALEYVELAIAAVDVLAASENYTLEYVEGGEKTFENIMITENTPFIVKQAVERAQSAYYYIVADRFDKIEDGYETDYTYNGHKIYRKVLPSNATVFFYGTLETGYQYLTLNKDGSFSVYENDISKAGTVNGNIVYENKRGDFGKGVYFTITGGKYTYYELANGVFIEKAPTVYNGEYFKTLDNGTEVFKDGEIYYSVNEDGTYTRYNFSRSMSSCLEESLAGRDKILNLFKEVQANESISDTTIYDKLLERIENEKRISGGEEEEEVIEETSKYSTENVVAVTFGDNYKTVILNYNNYSIRIEYQGIVYTISAYGFVEHEPQK